MRSARGEIVTILARLAANDRAPVAAVTGGCINAPQSTTVDPATLD